MTSKPRRAAFALAVAIGLTAIAATARADDPGGCGNRTREVSGTTWERLGAPRFTAGPQRVTGYAVDPRLPERVVATNGVAVGRTIDAGCHWEQTFAVPEAPTADQPYTSKTTRVVSVTVADNGDAYVLLDDHVKPRVLVSTDAAVRWTSIDAGLGPSTDPDEPPRLVAAPTEGTVLVLTHPTPRVNGVPDDVVWQTTDSGSTWVPGTPTTLTVDQVPPVRDVVVAAQGTGYGSQTFMTWAATDNGVYLSYNSGATWTAIGAGRPDPLAGIALRGAGGTAELATWEQSGARLYVSSDAGTSWLDVDAPAPVGSAAFGPGGTNLFAGTRDGRVVQLDPATLRWRPLWDAQPALRDVTTTSTTAGELYGCTCNGSAGDAVWRRTAARIAPPPRPRGSLPKAPSYGGGFCMPSRPIAPATKDWGRPALMPAKDVVPLAPGGSAAIPVTLHLPPQELDLHLLADMGPRGEFTFCPVKHGELAAAARLQQVRNVRPGVGVFGDYPGGTNYSDAFRGGAGDFVYQRRRRVGAVDQSLYDAVYNMPTNWETGTPTGDGGGLEATYESVTGAGRVISSGRRSPYDVLPGLDARFGMDAYKLVLLMTQVRFSTLERRPGYLGADFATTRAALRANGVHFAGIWMDNARNKQASEDPSGRPDLVDLATASGTFSTREIDCQDDSFVDVHRGGPVVCDYAAPAEGDFFSHDTTLALEIERMVTALENRQPVTVGPLVPGEAGFAGVAPAVHPNVELLRGATLPYTVTLRCDAGLIGATRAVTLAARVAGKVVATADVLVSCPLPVPPPPHVVGIGPPIPPVPVPNPVPHPGPNPGQAPEVVPNPAPNPAQVPQAQPQPVAHGVPVPQQQKEPALAFARAANRLQAELAGEHPMSSSRRSRLPTLPAGALLAMALATSLGYVARMPARARRR